MTQPKRHGSTDFYRYCFQGQEKDDEVKGEANSLDYGARFLDPRVGRWLSLDAINKNDQGNYNFAANNPIIFIDKGGDDDFYYDQVTNSILVRKTGAPHRFFFTEYIFTEDDSPIQYGTPAVKQYPIKSKEVSKLLSENVILYRHALKRASNDEEYKAIYNAYSDPGNAVAAQTLATTLAAPALVAVGMEILAAYGMNAIGTFILNEAKDELLSQATGGASDVYDLSKMAYKGVKELSTIVLNRSDEGISLLYRSASDAELEDIIENGVFRPNPNGSYSTGKLFAMDARDAAVQSVQNFRWEKSPFNIIEVEVPNSVLDKSNILDLDFFPIPGSMNKPSIDIPLDELENIKLNKILDSHPVPKLNDN